MALLIWKEELATGITRLDNDHRKLVALINELHDAMATGKANDVLGKILGELITYTRNHFATEERLMQQHAYPNYLVHKREHDELTAKVLDLQTRFLAQKTGLTTSTFTFLKNWLTDHILGTDKQYGPYFKERRVA